MEPQILIFGRMPLLEAQNGSEWLNLVCSPTGIISNILSSYRLIYLESEDSGDSNSTGSIAFYLSQVLPSNSICNQKG